MPHKTEVAIDLYQFAYCGAFTAATVKEKTSSSRIRMRPRKREFQTKAQNGLCKISER